MLHTFALCGDSSRVVNLPSVGSARASQIAEYLKHLSVSPYCLKRTDRTLTLQEYQPQVSSLRQWISQAGEEICLELSKQLYQAALALCSSSQQHRGRHL